MKQLKKKAQSLTEYTIVAGIVAIVLVAMGTPFRRTIQRVIKDVCDVIGLQSGAEQASGDISRSQLVNSVTDARMEMTALTNSLAGDHSLQTLRETTINSLSYTNLGVVDD